jgi:hypothetical protein
MKYERFQSYELTYTALAAAGGGDQKSFQVEVDYDFWWTKAQAFVFDAAGLGVSRLQWPNIEVLLQEGASNQQLVNQAASINSLFGSGEIPFILPRPHPVQGGSTMVATVTNRHTLTAFSVRLCFSGVQVLRGQPLKGARATASGRMRRRRR